MSEPVTPSATDTDDASKGGILSKIGDLVAEKILPKLVELLWPKVENLFVNVLLPKLVGMFPLFAASVAKTVIDQIPGVNLVKNVADIAEDVRDHVNVALPDIDIPILSDIFDLTEFLSGGKK